MRRAGLSWHQTPRDATTPGRGPDARRDYVPRSTIVDAETIAVIQRAGTTDEEAPMTSEQVAVITERLDNLLRRFDSLERSIARERTEERERQRHRDEDAEQWKRDIEQRMLSQERWRVYLLGAAGLVMLALGLAPAWIGLVIG